jgi:hypothetical protein
MGLAILFLPTAPENAPGIAEKSCLSPAGGEWEKSGQPPLFPRDQTQARKEHQGKAVAVPTFPETRNQELPNEYMATPLDFMQRFGAFAARAGALQAPVLFVVVIGMLLVPLPGWTLDILLIANIGLAFRCCFPRRRSPRRSSCPSSPPCCSSPPSSAWR